MLSASGLRRESLRARRCTNQKLLSGPRLPEPRRCEMVRLVPFPSLLPSLTVCSYNCGNEGHLSRDCPEGPKDNKTCYRCGQSGHISRECPQGGGPIGGGNQGGSQECYKVGHIARNCPDAYGGNSYGGGYGGGGQGKTCYSCGGYGHMSRECVNGSNETERQ
ncbi:hypothetical protein F5B22DRAFT_229591 [Xylaria bambusicola]|uniref:uncharacterized protein n=1 Tax=Xylaria bambusicola TaxID=326684 RepID=UPI0020083846|nr:uncharacterized protein F5B22DRAFT_229591 [Xylaria bambusicola]KAI0514489.1 hypothetical protein F5B22DRAFT_229591 [Xylaria bambusicola]